jgi:hypothetical protein
VIKATGLVNFANGVTVTKTLREVTGRSLYDCKDMYDAVRYGRKDTLVEIEPNSPMTHRRAMDLLIKAGVILVVDDVAVPPAAEIDLLRQEMRTQVERMAVMLGGVVEWSTKE